MKRVLSFEQYTQRANEADMFGVTTSTQGNLPPGYKEEEDFQPSKRDIEPLGSPEHKLKLVKSKSGQWATNLEDVALLEGPNGEKYIWYWGSNLDDPDLWEGTLLYDSYGDYEIDANAVEVAANRLKPSDFGKGLDDWESENTVPSDIKQIVEIDPELAEDLIDWLDEWMGKTRDSKLEIIKEVIIDYLKDADKSFVVEEFGIDEYDESETDGKPGDVESETDETTEVVEKAGISSAIRGILFKYLEDNKDATYSEVKKFIEKEIPGWDFRKEDFEEAQGKILSPSQKGLKETI